MDIIGESLLCLQNEARKLNHQEVVAEDQRKKLPSNWAAKRQRIEWEEEEETRRKVTLGRKGTEQTVGKLKRFVSEITYE